MTKILVNSSTNKALANSNGTKVFTAPASEPVVVARRIVNGKVEMPTGAYVLPSSVTELGIRTMQYAFSNSTITSADLSSLTTIKSYGMRYCFQSCTSLTTVDLSSLATISSIYVLNYAFSECTALQTLSFPALNSSSFGSNTNQFNNMLSDVTGCTVHFPSNLQSVIGSWSSVVGGFGGMNITVLFDLPATN